MDQTSPRTVKDKRVGRRDQELRDRNHGLALNKTGVTGIAAGEWNREKNLVRIDLDPTSINIRPASI